MSLKKIPVGVNLPINEGVKFINAAIEAADKAKTDSTNAKTTAGQALSNSEDTQTQLDQVVIDGDSSVEAAQARIDADGNTHDTLKIRLDTEYTETHQKIDDNYSNVTSHLADAMTYDKKQRNSSNVLQILNPYKNIENIHPKALYFKNGWNGFKYWMAYTPYPKGNVTFENPCLAGSNDGVDWETPPGVTNPVEPFSGDYNIYNNDTHLVYVESTKTLEIWWRLANVTTRVSTIKRRTSTNGKDWTPTEDMLIGSIDGNDYLSPSIIHEDGKYKMWAVSDTRGVLRYNESVNGKSWTTPTVVNVNWGSLTPWHLDVIKTTKGYEFVVQAWQAGKTNNDADIYYVLSEDLVTFSEPILILEPSKELGKFDNRGIYRSSLLEIDGVYYLYYSGVSVDGKRGIALSYGENIRLLKGFESRSSPSQKIYGLEETYTKQQTAFNLDVENFISVKKQTSNPQKAGAFCYEDALSRGTSGGTLKVHDGTDFNPLQIAFIGDFTTVWNGTIQTLTSGTETLVNYSNRDRDIGIRWTVADMKYTVRADGIFNVQTHLDVNSFEGGSFELYVKVNGTTKHVLAYEENITGRKIIQGLRTITMKKNDTLSVYVKHVGTGSPKISSDRFLTVEKLNHNW